MFMLIYLSEMWSLTQIVFAWVTAAVPLSFGCVLCVKKKQDLSVFKVLVLHWSWSAALWPCCRGLLWVCRLHVFTCLAKMAASIGLFSSVHWISVTQDRRANWELHCSITLNMHLGFPCSVICSKLGAHRFLCEEKKPWQYCWFIRTESDVLPLS